MNHVTLCGRITKDLELGAVGQNDTPKLSFQLALNRPDQNKTTDWIDCQAWKKTAENFAKYVHKGDMVLVEGSIQTSQWKDQNGSNRKNMIVNVFKFYLLPNKNRPSTEPITSVPSDDAALAGVNF